MPITDEALERASGVDRFILLLLGAKGCEAVPGPVHLQKGMYLLSRVFPELAEEAGFGPYPQDPCSDVVSGQTDALTASGLVKSAPEGYALTARGREAHRIMKRRSSADEAETAEDFKDFFNDLTRDELLAFVYFSDPREGDLGRESGEYKRLVPRRKRLALSMYRKDKVSVQKAAQISGECLEDFLAAVRD